MNQVAKRTEQTPAEQPSELIAFVSMIERAARDPNVDVDKMERLLAMQEKIIARNAEQAFSAAMSAAQSEMRPVAADANNPQTKSRYASYLALDKALRPIYVNHGFALSFDTATTQNADVLVVLCDVMHTSGHTRRYSVPMPADGKGAKGGDVMTKTHATGAAMTYGQRYLLKMIFNIAVGEDNDRGGETYTRITQDQADTIREAIEAAGKSRDQFLKLFKIERIEDLAADVFQTALDRINGKNRA
ncbi:MAG: ERF family protein [Nitrospiraceae bacterium]